MLRRCTVATCAAAWRSPRGSSGLRTISVSVRPAPNIAPLRLSSGMCRTLIKTLGAVCRRFMFGRRSVPPAIRAAFGPSPARIRVASPSVRGARKSNHGSRIMALHLVAVAAFPWRRHDEGLRIGDLGEVLGPDARRFAFRFLLERTQYLVGCNRDLVDAHANGVVDGVRYRRRHRQERPLPHLLRAEGTVRIRLLDE